jgi:hypothetical protein
MDIGNDGGSGREREKTFQKTDFHARVIQGLPRVKKNRIVEQ